MRKVKINKNSISTKRDKVKGHPIKSNPSQNKKPSFTLPKSVFENHIDLENDAAINDLDSDNYEKVVETGYDEELDDVYGSDYKVDKKSRIGSSFILSSENSSPVNIKNKSNKTLLKRTLSQKKYSRK